LETVKKMKESVSRPQNTATTQEVELTFYAPQAKKASIAGTFNDWNTKSMPMKKDKSGVWRIKIKLSPGRYEYKFFIDGAWDENVPGGECVQNTFGTNNCVMNIRQVSSR
jgi:1,4-alpha-glucan branching enzyme